MSVAVSKLRMRKPFQAYALHGRWDLYAQSLEEWGLHWILEMHFPRLAAHVELLRQIPGWEDWTPLLRLYSEARCFSSSPERFESLFLTFQEQGNRLAAAGTVCVGVMAHCHYGNALWRLSFWDEAASELLAAAPLSVQCRTALLCMRAMAQLVGHAEISRALALLEQIDQVELIDENRSVPAGPSLLVLTAALRGLCRLLQGDLLALRRLFAETAPYLDHGDVSPISRAMFRILPFLMAVLQGAKPVAPPVSAERDPVQAGSFLPAPVSVLHGLSPLFETVPPEEAANREQHLVQARSWKIWMNNSSGQAWLHFFSSLLNILNRDCRKALAHGRAALEHGKKGGDGLAVHLSVLPVAQAMGDLGMDEGSREILTTWMDRWRASGADYYAACGAMELAGLLQSKGEKARARELYAQAVDWTPLGDELVVLNRPKSFLRDLRADLIDPPTLEVAWAKPEAAVVHIQALGGFCLSVSGRLIPEQNWRAAKTKLLLKAVIVHGGSHVSREQLQDMLWPEADGDMAQNNFKVAISRLRNKLNSFCDEYLDWLVVAEGKVSLAKTLCTVDCLRFQDAARKAIQTGTSALELSRALDMYRDDFLPAEQEPPWVVDYRQRLRGEFARAAVLFAKLSLRGQVPEQGLKYLVSLFHGPSASEEVFALLMQTYLTMGFPSEALQVFRQARLRLKREFDILPGAVLLRLAQQARERS